MNASGLCLGCAAAFLSVWPFSHKILHGALGAKWLVVGIALTAAFVRQMRRAVEPAPESVELSLEGLSPEEARRENWWYYAQGGPGVYAGDTAFGREFDVRAQLKDIDTRRCKVSIISGDYDYSALPDVSRQVAEAIPGAQFTLIEGLGHFPVIEDYAKLRPSLHGALEHMLEEEQSA